MPVYILFMFFVFCSSSSTAQPISIAEDLTNGTIADADELNAKFTEVADSINQRLLVDDASGLTAVGKEALLYRDGEQQNKNSAFGDSALRGSANTPITGLSNTALGYSAMPGYSGVGDYNTAVGANSLLFNTGDFNTAVGRTSLYGSSTGGSGSYNAALGAGALRNNSGDYNVGVGFVAGIFMVGSQNIAVGYRAGENVTTANNSIAIGEYALGGYSGGANPPSDDEATTGNSNIAIGEEALRFNTTGSLNLALGRRAMYATLDGKQNVAAGTEALGELVDGEGNLGLGHWALSDLGKNLAVLSSFNTAVGYQAGAAVTNGEYNTFIGARASNGFFTRGDRNVSVGSQTNTQGSASLFNTVVIGHDAGVEPASGTDTIINAVAIGAGAVVKESSVMQLGNLSLSKVLTEARLTTGEVTYPNFKGSSGQVLKLSGADTGELLWQDDLDGLTQLAGKCNQGDGLILSNGSWICVKAWTNVATAINTLEAKIEDNNAQLLGIIDQQAAQIAAQQEQIVQLQRMVEHQFAAR